MSSDAHSPPAGAGAGEPGSGIDRRQLFISLGVLLVLLVLLFWQAPIVPLLVFAALLLAVIQRGLATAVSEHTGLGL